MRYPVGHSKEDFERNWYNAQGFGAKTSYGYHEAADLNLKTGGDSDMGVPVFAIADGEVTSVHRHTGASNFGNHIHIKHDGPWGTVWSHSAHMLDIFVQPGDRVQEGQLIGSVGKSGTVFAHLHFAIKRQPTGVDGIARTREDLNKWIDPLPFIEKWEAYKETPPAINLTPQTKIPAELLPRWGKAEEIQAIDGMLNDKRIAEKDRDELKRKLAECEARPPVKEVVEVVKEVPVPVEVIKEVVVDNTGEPVDWRKLNISFENPLSNFFFSLVKRVES